MSESILPPATRVGPYEIVLLLGEGGMGQVYKARDLRLSREVALKIVRTDAPPDKAGLARFADEAKAASLLSHPNIVAVYDVGDKDGTPYIISELLQGETLRDRLASGVLPARKAIDYGTQILRGLAAAHDKGIVHRDLKPENLFLTKDGLVKILDFGIAKLGRQGDEHADSNVETRSHTTPGTLIGTVGYMSPEQVRGLVVDHRSDLFAFGAVLFEMLTGKRAFKGTTVPDTLSAILREDPLEAPGSGSGVPAGFIRVVRRSLEKAPEDRFQTARDLAFALEGATTDSPTVREFAPPAPVPFRRRWGAGLAAAALVAVMGPALWAAVHYLTPSASPTSFQRLTFRPGRVESARFARDGETILYSAKWGSRPIELFSTRASTRGERPLSLTDALITGISKQEELALLLRPRPVTWGVFEGTLARAPLAGGAPREVLEGVIAADWSPDGKDLAVVHVVEDTRYRLEYPIGHVLVAPDAPGWISYLRISPRGDQVAFVENPVVGDMRGAIAVVDREGRRKILASGFAATSQLGWSPSGDEIWFGASRVNGTPDQIRGVSLSGRQRLIQEMTGGFKIFDIGPNGQVLGARATEWTEVRARARGSAQEAELAAADLSFLSDLSDDGKQVLGTDTGQGGGPNSRFYLQSTDGSPPLWLGEGDGQALSPDGRSVLVLLVHAQPQQLVVVPAGAGETHTLDRGDVVQYSRAVWDGNRRIVFSGADKKNATRLYVQNVAGGPPRAVTGDGVRLGNLGRPVSPDGQRVVAVGPDETPALYPLAGGEPILVPGLGARDVALCWTTDGRALMVARYDEGDDLPPRIERLDLASGRTQPWNRLGHTTPSGLAGDYRVLVTPDGESYAYNYFRSLSDLYLTSKMK